jgi:hypothetical protein
MKSTLIAVIVCVPWSAIAFGLAWLVRRHRPEPTRFAETRRMIERPVIINGEERQPQLRRCA